MILFAITLTATAQNDNQMSALISLSNKFTLIKWDKQDSKTWYAVMSHPISYYNYYAVTGKNIRPKNRDVNDVITRGVDREKFAAKASSLYSGMFFHVATATELQRALAKHYNISSENGPYSCATSGFYLACDYKTYKRMKLKVKEYLEEKKSGKTVKKVKKTKNGTKIRRGKRKVTPGAVG